MGETFVSFWSGTTKKVISTKAYYTKFYNLSRFEEKKNLKDLE